MSKRARRGLVATVVLGLLIALGVYSVVGTRGAATAQALPDAGKFRAGSALGEERAGFSGRMMVQVFTTAESKDWPTISACLQAAAVEAELGFFTGILVDEVAEPTVEATLRERDGLRVVVRALNGAFLGGLPAGFTCQDFMDLLKRIRAASISAPEPSPIYSNLLESAAAIDDLIAKGERTRAEGFVAFLEELEGSTSPAVQAAKASLAR